MSDTHYLPETAVNDGSRNAFQMLKDIWWALRTQAGSILTAPITKYGSDGLPSGDPTTAEAEFGWNRQNFATVNEKLDRIITKIGA
jgi:hypothetical protein